MVKRLKPRTILEFSSDHDPDCECVRCRNRQAFSAPSELVDNFLSGDIVLFVGAGVSTEAKDLLHDTFYDTIVYANAQPRDTALPFPDVMQEFCSSPSGRTRLIELIRERFDYIYGHRELYDEATRFHRSLATMLTVKTIVTTNWDTYFEDECHAVPLVDDRDIALLNSRVRHVLKIHGSISNLGSIVATRDDYRACARRLNTGVVGAYLKSLLASKTVVFIGYSLKDDDFLQVYRSIKKSLSTFHRKAYFISPQVSNDDDDRLVALGLYIIKTDGENFINRMKEVAFNKLCIQNDVMYQNVADLLTEVRSAHEWMHDNYSTKRYPQILPSSWYHDGLIHALERIIRLRPSGEMSDLHRLTRVSLSYDKFHELMLRDRNYSDSAYCLGYSNGYYFASLPVEEQSEIGPPLFYYPRMAVSNRTAFRKNINRLPAAHKGMYGYVESIMSKYTRQMIPQHKPQLNLGEYLNDDDQLIV